MPPTPENPPTRDDKVLEALDAHLRAGPEPRWEDLLAMVLAHTECPVGTLHLVDASGLLALAAQRGLPPIVIEKVTRIPVGKGMAGIAAERREPVQVCNLQDDASGVVRPGAKLTKMEGSIACPILRDGVVLGVLGVAKPTQYEFTAAETAFLMAVGSRIANRLASR